MVVVHDFVLTLRAQRLTLIASLKAAQLASNIEIMQTAASFVNTRVLIQEALTNYSLNSDNTPQSWNVSQQDMYAAIGGRGSTGQALLLQSIVYGRDGNGPGGPYGLLNATAKNQMHKIALPYTYASNGSNIYLGDDFPATGPYGYPPLLYPNFTFYDAPYAGRSNIAHASCNGVELGPDSTLLLGPWMINSTFALASLTNAVVDNSDMYNVLGWMTIVMDARLISAVMDAAEGPDETGETYLIGPSDNTNILPSNISDATLEPALRFVLPLNDSYRTRHPDHVFDSSNSPFNASQFPIIAQAIVSASKNSSNNSGASVRAVNEAGKAVSVGYAIPDTDIVNWVVVLEQSREEVWQPINHLRNAILICLFVTAVFMAVIAFPLAHFASLPILRLKKATERSIEPPGGSRSSLGSFGSLPDAADGAEDTDPIPRKEGFMSSIKSLRHLRQENNQARRNERRKRAFRIPGKVKERNYCIKDELSELTTTFNEMSDELMQQYSKLEERVQERTAELELSRKAAEAANESKTLFIANISHELKTPLNGILGMCAVCMQEDDPTRLKRSLGIIYKSGDLLLNLLTDLLTFSKNQVGQSLSLDEKEFRLRDISSQILAIFDKQAKEGQIELRIEFEGAPTLATPSGSPDRSENGPAGTGRVRDMILWGDVHRILQVVINLVSNSLKFTPRGGLVTLTIRCLPEIPNISRQSSLMSRKSRVRSARHRSSNSTIATTKINTANAINAKDKPHGLLASVEGAASPPCGKYLYYEFEVRDTGPGIPENLLDKIFEPFVQGDLGLSKKFGGTGLGLSICSQLSQLMSGSISVRSTVGRGSTFTLKIPLRHVQTRADSSASSFVNLLGGSSRRSSVDSGERVAESPVVKREDSSSELMLSPSTAAIAGAQGSDSKPRLIGLSQPFFAASEPLESPGSQSGAMKQITQQATHFGRIRVLVAEDNKVNQEVVLRMLKLEEIYDVTVAKDGQEALDMVKESMGVDGKPFNLIFMDVQMPNVDGLTSTRLIREIGYQAPIVALTAFAEESNIKDCLDSGMNYFLSKPIRRPQLKKVLKEYCAPIPEEADEDATPTEQRAAERRGSGVNTTIVMVGSTTQPAATSPPSASSTATTTAEQPRPPPEPSVEANDDSRPVSPHSHA